MKSPVSRLFTLIAFALGVAATAHGRAPNIVFFLIDDWGWTDAACYGSKLYETPNIDRLATQGMKFSDAYAACTVCSPTRAATMTGKYPARLHLTDWIAGHVRPYAKLKIPEWTKYLPLEETTIAEALRARGYATGLFGKWHLGGEAFFPEHKGFDVNVGGCDRGQPGAYFPPYGIVNIKDERPGEFLSDRLTRDAISFIDANRERPFFLYFPHYAVHTPLAGKPDVIAKYQKKLATGTYTQTNAIYAALVESVDDSVGAIVRRLEELKLDQDTIIILTGDNGGLSGTVNAQGWRPGPTRNDPLRLGKGSPYEGGVRVPLIVRWPGVVPAGSACATPVSSVDYFPTLLEAASAPATAGLDGESLLGLFKGATSLKRTALYWHYPHYHPGGATPYSAIRSGDWKLIHFYEDNHVELYNLRTDLGEKNDVAKANATKAAELRAQLDAWRASVGAQAPTTNPDYDPKREWQEAGQPQKAAKKAGKA
jgi:arylsulfatase A-like enzyme